MKAENVQSCSMEGLCALCCHFVALDMQVQAPNASFSLDIMMKLVRIHAPLFALEAEHYDLDSSIVVSEHYKVPLRYCGATSSHVTEWLRQSRAWECFIMRGYTKPDNNILFALNIMYRHQTEIYTGEEKILEIGG